MQAVSFGVTLIVGIGNALYAPVFSAVLPVLVPRRDMAGAISLNSAQMNGSRVIGPEPAYECSLAFLAATFSGAERHERRLSKVRAIEATG